MSQQRAPRRFDERWRLSRAGIVNIWHYLDNEFDLSGGRMILRGTNGSGSPARSRCCCRSCSTPTAAAWTPLARHGSASMS